MLPQEHMIARVRALCAQDDRLDAAMLYGSFTYNEGDQFSDIEFLLFFEDDSFEQIQPRAWLEQIAPVAAHYVNEHGIHAVIFDNLVRGEFHFHAVSEMTIAQAWPGVLAFPSLESTLVIDKHGRLAPYLAPIIGLPPDRLTPPALDFLVNSFVNWAWFGFTVWRRGEYARALEILTITGRNLLQLARAVEGQTDHWLTPSRLLEQDLSPAAYERYRACTAPLDPDALRNAYRAAWGWGWELLDMLHAQTGVAIPRELAARIGAIMESA